MMMIQEMVYNYYFLVLHIIVDDDKNVFTLVAKKLKILVSSRLQLGLASIDPFTFNFYEFFNLYPSLI